MEPLASLWCMALFFHSSGEPGILSSLNEEIVEIGGEDTGRRENSFPIAMHSRNLTRNSQRSASGLWNSQPRVALPIITDATNIDHLHLQICNTKSFLF